MYAELAEEPWHMQWWQKPSGLATCALRLEEMPAGAVRKETSKSEDSLCDELCSGWQFGLVSSNVSCTTSESP